MLLVSPQHTGTGDGLAPGVARWGAVPHAKSKTHVGLGIYLEFRS